MDPDEFVNVVVVYPVQRRFLPNPHPDSGFPPGNIRPRNTKGAELVAMDDRTATPDNTIVLHFHKDCDDDDTKQLAVAVANAAESRWTDMQTICLRQTVEKLTRLFEMGRPE